MSDVPVRDATGAIPWRPGPFLALLAGLSLVTAGLIAVLPQGIRTGVSLSTLVSDRQGTTLRLTTAADGQYRLWTRLSEFAPETIEAVLVKEDAGFWYNPGVDFPALLKAGWHSLVLRDYRAGASTITMQAVRLIWKLDTGSIGGKLLQVAAALAVSALVPRTEILETYLNLAPCGANVQGLGTASRIWFGKEPATINLAESLALAVLPQDPADRNPAIPSRWPDIELARARLAAQYLGRHPGTADELRGQLAMPLAFRRDLPFLAPHLTTRLMAEHPDRRRLQTTIDLGLQGLVERTISHFTQRNGTYGVNNACALLVKADTMEVLASVGSADFADGEIQGQVDGTKARRSPGSTLKPFIYALAIQQGLIHPLSVLKDARVHFGGYNPDNFDNEFEGPIRATDALVKSRNVPAVTLAGQIRSPDLYAFLQSSGLKLPFPRDHYGLSIVLGGAEVTMTELVRLYGSLAGSGEQAGLSRPIRYLMDEPQGRSQRLLSADAAWLVHQMLKTKPRPDADLGWNASPFAADSAAELARSSGGLSLPGGDTDRDSQTVAYKTGTSIGFRDAWSIGIADGLILAVWVGDFAGASNPEFIGLKTAAPLMFEIVDAWRANRLAARYTSQPEDRVPEGVVRVPVCAVSGQIAGKSCTRVVDAPFIAGVSPIATCSVHQVCWIDQISGLRRSREIPGVTKTVLYEIWPADIMALFAQAGLSRAAPPAFDPFDGFNPLNGPAGGLAPQILSPVKELRYISGAGGIEERLPLVSAVGSDARTVWWFMDDAVLGEVKRTEAWYWKPTPGHHQVRAVDDLGRSAQAEFEVE